MREIRGHHLFCMALFAGHGYSQEFVENMAAVIRELEEGESFCLASRQDSVCAACPNLLPDGGCTHGTEDVLARDAAAFKVLGLAPGQEASWEETRSLPQKVTADGFKQVCGGCRWAREGLCSLALLQKQLR